MARIFGVPFAAQGDREEVPNPTQGDGSVSFTQGFGYDYERNYEDPQAKDIRRESLNGLLHDITESLGDIQLTGVARWSEDAAPYPQGALVWHNNQAWLSLVGNNSVTPTLGSSWTSQADPRLFLTLANNLSDLPNAATARSNLGLGNSATRNVGTGSTQVAAGNDSRITGAAQKSANLSDLSNASTARSNLGLGAAALLGTTSSRTSTSTDHLLLANAMNNHRTSGDHDGRYANSSVTISAGSGLIGGGNLTANRTLSVDGSITRNSDFTQSLNANGWARLPNGLILQWGSILVNGGATFTFPITFPVAFLEAVASTESNTFNVATWQQATRSSVYLQAWNPEGHPQTAPFTMTIFAIGR